MKKVPQLSARRWFVKGRVQGVGFRWFVVHRAREIGLTGWVRNEEDGRVQTFAVGSPEQLDRLAGLLYLGPPLAHVYSVEQIAAAPESHTSFEIR